MKITADIIEAIKNCSAALVCGHIRPDGDCISSALAVRYLCEKLGKPADAVCDADPPSSFLFLPDYELFCKLRSKKYDLFIAVDCANDKRLGEYKRYLDDAAVAIDIDHHPTNEGYGDINYIDDSASSTCAIIYELFKDTGLIDKKAATLLYTGLSTDTGHFMHANTDARVFKTAEALTKFGIDVGKLNHDIYCNKKLERIRLTARALDSIKLYKDGKIAVMKIMLSDLAACGCTSEDTEGLIDFATSIGGVRISVAMCEQPGGLFRVSLRAVEADVSAVAGVFGGGGHKLASGCMINGTGDEVEKKIVDAASRELDKR